MREPALLWYPKCMRYCEAAPFACMAGGFQWVSCKRDQSGQRSFAGLLSCAVRLCWLQTKGGATAQDNNYAEISNFLRETEEYLIRLAAKVANVSAHQHKAACWLCPYLRSSKLNLVFTYVMLAGRQEGTQVRGMGLVLYPAYEHVPYSRASLFLDDPQARVNQEAEVVVREAMEEARRTGYSEEEVRG